MVRWELVTSFPRSRGGKIKAGVVLAVGMSDLPSGKADGATPDTPEAVRDALGAFAADDVVQFRTEFGDEGPRAGERYEFHGVVDRATTDALGASQAILDAEDGDRYRLAESYTTGQVRATRLTAGNEKEYVGVVTRLDAE